MGGRRRPRSTEAGGPDDLHTEKRFRRALARVAAGATVAEVCRSLGISRATFYRWKRDHLSERSKRQGG